MQLILGMVAIGLMGAIGQGLGTGGLILITVILIMIVTFWFMIDGEHGPLESSFFAVIIVVVGLSPVYFIYDVTNDDCTVLELHC